MKKYDLAIELHRDPTGEIAMRFNNQNDCMFTVSQQAFEQYVKHLIEFSNGDAGHAHYLLDAMDFDQPDEPEDLYSVEYGGEG